MSGGLQPSPTPPYFFQQDTLGKLLTALLPLTGPSYFDFLLTPKDHRNLTNLTQPLLPLYCGSIGLDEVDFQASPRKIPLPSSNKH